MSSPRRMLESIWNDDIAKLEAFIGTKMELKLKNLPQSAVYKKTPWAAPNWPAHLDSINHKWSKNEPSPAEKYATAFGLDVKSFMDKVSAQNGVDSRKLDTVCAKRAGATSGYCIPTWYGICDAWAPASIFEQEPNCPVTFNGVTFQPMDVKALVTDVYDNVNVSAVYAGERYYGTDDSIDEYGSHTDYTYRDLNPGLLHIVATNLSGLLKKTFIIDRDAGAEVWNQPVVSFKVNKQTTLTPEKAAQKFGAQEYSWNNESKSIVYTNARLSWINETYTDGGLVASGLIKKFTVGATYDYLLELDEDQNIAGETKTRHRHQN
ncbi:Transglutaminase elicitor [Phytophthora infestans]|uniref:Transglutaminase elicitor n=1 Tax=Phytophthora infestans TaxID=4787 RepID=A0A833TIK8_PHYIN|nr:Transglutaminase elicitor [Phytophthora infestans]KAF4139259.1 Transglutaminase elicitor [Phytophthora infestans]